jgi:alkylation response protein AidB-like acyl-CoA dehydrogenase
VNALTEDQRMLAETMRAVLTKKATPAAVRAAMTSSDRFDRELWTLLCEQVGVGGISIDENYGGSGGGLVDQLIVAEELGRALVPSPALGSSGVCAAVIEASDDEEAKARLLPDIAAGSSIVSLCAADEQGDWSHGVPVEARYDDEWSLTGRARYVLDAASASTLLVAARSAGGVELFEVDAHARGVLCSGGATMDPTRALYEVTFDGAAARRLETTDASAVLEQAIDRGMVLLAGEQVGAAARCLELTVEYTKSRVQFARPIGSFQALKHRMADLHVLVETARATAYFAASSPDRHTSAGVARAYCSEAFTAVAAECVQLHGGIAITWEHDMQLYFKRAHSSSQLFGLPRVHVAALEGAAGLPRRTAQPPSDARRVESE